MKTKHILLPTDFSNNARNAFDYALRFFQKEPCKFYILNAFEAGASSLSSTMGKVNNTRLYRAMKETSQRDITSIVKDLESKNENPLHEFKGLSIADSLLNAIGKTTIDTNISYIFMGTKGSSAMKEIFMGSSTIKVLKNINFCPIVAVPEHYSFNNPSEIAFATNFEHDYLKVELIPLIDMVKLWKPTISIVHVDTGKQLTPSQKKSKELLKKRLQGLPIKFEEIKETSQIAAAITQYTAKNKQIGMIAIVNYWHSFFEKLTQEEVVKHITFNTEVPLLILPLID